VDNEFELPFRRTIAGWRKKTFVNMDIRMYMFHAVICTESEKYHNKNSLNLTGGFPSCERGSMERNPS
jgi:hypothetical protein